MTLLFNTSQVVTLVGGPRRGPRMNDLGIISNGAVIFRDGAILEVADSDSLINKYPNEPRLDAQGNAVIPGFVDPHTHLVWAGDRAAEFEMRLQGKTYLEILKSGGGIISTVKATRQADLLTLKEQTRSRANRMFSYGTTTAEVKTGYGLNQESEMKQLAAILDLSKEGPLEMVPTYLAAHAIAPEYTDDPDGYTRLICDELLPELFRWWNKNQPEQKLPFIDVFCEQGAFTLEQTRKILATAQKAGFPLKIHVDEFMNLGGTSLAVELNAISADHLVKTSPMEIKMLAESDTIAVSLPCTPFGLADPSYTPARSLIDQGGRLAIATDCNPGTAWCESMQFVIALACRSLKLTPAEAVCAATINSAAAIQKDHKVGSIEKGKQADLLILNVGDFRHLAYRFGTNLVSTIIKNGEVYINK